MCCLFILYVIGGTPFKKFKFPEKIETTNSPPNGIGQLLLPRQQLIDRTIATVVQKNETGRFRSYYWRGMKGCGKTTFLSLLGRALLQKGFDVFWVDTALQLSPQITPAGETFLQQIEQSIRPCALLIDECDQLPRSVWWNRLLKQSCPKNLLVLGAGVPSLVGTTQQFVQSYPVSELLLTEHDIEDIVAFWKLHDKELKESGIRAVCKSLFNYCGGHMFPVVKLSEHMFTTSQNEMENHGKYIRSEAFSLSQAYAEVIGRCFSDLNLFYNHFERVMSGNNFELSELGKLERLGYWNSQTEWFSSDFMLSVVLKSLRMIRKSEDTILLDDAFASKDAQDRDRILESNLKMIISTGFQNLTPSDFTEPNQIKYRYEISLGFKWAIEVNNRIKNIYVSPETLASTSERKRNQLDFYFNGRTDLAVELARNGSPEMITKKVGDLSHGKYAEWKGNFAVLNIVVHTDKYEQSADSRQPPVPVVPLPVLPDHLERYEDRVFTFMRETNRLYCGRSLFVDGIVRSLPKFPQSRQFSSSAFTILNGMTKLLR